MGFCIEYHVPYAIVFRKGFSLKLSDDLAYSTRSRAEKVLKLLGQRSHIKPWGVGRA